MGRIVTASCTLVTTATASAVFNGAWRQPGGQSDFSITKTSQLQTRLPARLFGVSIRPLWTVAQRTFDAAGITARLEGLRKLYLEIRKNNDSMWGPNSIMAFSGNGPQIMGTPTATIGDAAMKPDENLIPRPDFAFVNQDLIRVNLYSDDGAAPEVVTFEAQVYIELDDNGKEG